MMGIVDKTSKFFDAHPKHQKALEKAIASAQPEISRSKLKDLCRTRWVQRIDALYTFQSLLPSIFLCMETICSEGPSLWSSDSITDARSLQLAVSTTDFISALVITNFCLNYLHSLTCSLQAERKDIVDAVNEIDHVKAALQSVRKDMDIHHKKWFDVVEKLCDKLGTEVSLSRKCGHQAHRSNTPASTPSQYYCRIISIPLLDHILMEFDSRFDPHQKKSTSGFRISAFHFG